MTPVAAPFADPKAAGSNSAYLHNLILPSSHEVVETCGVSQLVAGATIIAYLHKAILPLSRAAMETCGALPLLVHGMLVPNFTQPSKQMVK
jgi:hypothetical protein